MKIDFDNSTLSAADRGSADAYYGRKRKPHYRAYDEENQRYVHVEVKEGSAEHVAYHKGYDGETDRKEW